MISDTSIDALGPKRLISLPQYHTRLCRIISREFLAARDHFSVAGIHDCRVGIKRWRVFAAFLQAILPDLDTSSYRKELSRIFKAAGRVRDCHIQQDLIRASRFNENWSLSEYYNELKSIELRARERFARAADRFDPALLDAAARIAESIPSGRTEQTVQAAFQKLELDLRETMRYEAPGGFREADLHAIRVRCKETRYVVEIIRACLSHRSHLGDLDDRLRDVHQPLGKWHDLDVALERLTAFLESRRETPLRCASAYVDFGRELREARDANLQAFKAAWGKLVRLVDRVGAM
jgi:CHAD domain-containing protein